MLTGVMYRTCMAPALPFEARTPAFGSTRRFADREVRETGSSLPSSLIPMRFRPILLMLSGVVVASSACSMDCDCAHVADGAAQRCE